MKTFIAFLMMTTSVFAADVKIDWEPVTGATGYRVSMSIDNGQTWQAPMDAGTTRPYTYTNVPEDKLVLFKIAAYSYADDSWNHYAGAWYDHRKKLGMPSKIGINQ